MDEERLQNIEHELDSGRADYWLECGTGAADIRALIAEVRGLRTALEPFSEMRWRNERLMSPRHPVGGGNGLGNTSPMLCDVHRARKLLGKEQSFYADRESTTLS